MRVPEHLETLCRAMDRRRDALMSRQQAQQCLVQASHRAPISARRPNKSSDPSSTGLQSVHSSAQGRDGREGSLFPCNRSGEWKSMFLEITFPVFFFHFVLLELSTVPQMRSSEFLRTLRQISLCPANVTNKYLLLRRTGLRHV